MAKSKRKRQQHKRRPEGHPARRTQVPLRSSAGIDIEREAALALAEARRRYEEALSPDTPPERIAALLVEELEDLPSPPGLAIRLRRDGSEERARAVAAEVQRLAPGSVTALTLVAEIAGAFDEDYDRAADLLDEALEAHVDPAGTVELAEHMLAAGRQLDAIELVREVLDDKPEEEDALAVYGQALEELHRRRGADEKLGPAGCAELDRFADRTGLYALRDAMRVLVEERRPELRALIDGCVENWVQQLHAAEGRAADDDFAPEPDDEERSEALLRFAIEHAWLMDGDPDEDVGDDFGFELEPELEQSAAPLALLATDPDVPPEISSAAKEWLRTVTYGLWQISDPQPGPGLWLTDIVTGARRYAAIPPEQLPGMSRWSVLLGALVSLDGVWRTTGAVVLLRPSEGDGAADLVYEASVAVAEELTGKRGRRPSRRRDPDPHGVIAEIAEPIGPEIAALMSKVLGSLLPGIVGDVWRRRATGPKLTNTDGHRLRMITADIAVNDPAAVAGMLAAHADFRVDDAGQLSWWGRELSELEREGALAQIRSLTGDGEPIEEPDEPQRWLRGRLEPKPDGFEISVNSDERLEALVELLRGVGAETELGMRRWREPPPGAPSRT